VDVLDLAFVTAFAALFAFLFAFLLAFLLAFLFAFLLAFLEAFLSAFLLDLAACRDAIFAALLARFGFCTLVASDPRFFRALHSSASMFCAARSDTGGCWICANAVNDSWRSGSLMAWE